MNGSPATAPQPPSRLGELGAMIAARLGLNFPPERWPDLQRGTETAARDFGFESADRFLDWVLGTRLDAAQLARLARHLTVGETYFMRERPALDLLSQVILPDLIRARRGVERRLRLWSAGCCTGEEAYTLAILLHGLLPDREAWQVDIRATDINPHFLRTANSGIYRPWSFRDLPPEWREQYFRPAGQEQYEIRADLRRWVTFSSLNLAADSYPSVLNDTNAMDVILCRNVLMYFTPEQAAKAVRKLGHCLLDGGWLLVGAGDLPSSYFTEPLVAEPSGLPAYQKRPVPPPQDEESDAGALYQDGRYGEAVAHLEHHTPALPEMDLLARALANQGRLAEARYWADRLVASHKLDPSALFLRAAIRAENGAVDGAIRDYRRALMLDPGFVLAHVALGHLARKAGHEAEAQENFEAALLLLRARPPGETIAESDGLTVGRMIDMLTALQGKEATLAC